MSQQLCLFDFERPFVDRFGSAFFRAIPKQPGIYLFFGARGRVLYVGQSKNLRVRLAYYKNARPEREPRKIIRLVHETRRIEIRRCETAEAAQLREIELIRQRRPKFNTALASSRAYSFFGLAATESDVVLRLSLSSDRRADEQWFGAFKNRGLCRRAFLSLGRVLWAEQACPANAYQLPLWLHERSRANAWSVPAAESAQAIAALLAGESEELLTRTLALTERCAEPFLKKIFESDLLVLTEFLLLARRMQSLRALSGKEHLAQEEIDPLQLRQRFVNRGLSSLSV